LLNPLQSVFKTPFKSAPFSKITPENFTIAIKKNITDSISLIKLISNQVEAPTFKNTINSLQDSSGLLSRNVSLLYNLNSSETSIELQEITKNIAPYLSKYKNDILLNKKLFKRVEFIYLKSDKSDLTTEQVTLLEKEYNEFVRNGALLSTKKKRKIKTY
jgi:peptidyl-dipeptidase Dcp